PGGPSPVCGDDVVGTGHGLWLDGHVGARGEPSGGGVAGASAQLTQLQAGRLRHEATRLDVQGAEEVVDQVELPRLSMLREEQHLLAAGKLRRVAGARLDIADPTA